MHTHQVENLFLGTGPLCAILLDSAKAGFQTLFSCTCCYLFDWGILPCQHSQDLSRIYVERPWNIMKCQPYSYSVTASDILTLWLNGSAAANTSCSSDNESPSPRGFWSPQRYLIISPKNKPINESTCQLKNLSKKLTRQKTVVFWWSSSCQAII